VGLGAALLAGLLMGAVARLMMRLVTLSAGHPGEFSLLGTVMILVVFVVPMLPGALLASLWRGRGRWLLLVAGTGLLLVGATGVALTDIGDVSDLPAARWVGLAASAAGVFAAILALPVLTLRLLDRGGRRAGADVGAAQVDLAG
jgi:hypothetical protein